MIKQDCFVKFLEVVMTSASDFGYLGPCAENLSHWGQRYGGLWFVQDINEFVGELSSTQLGELAAAYNEIARREDAVSISRWLDAQPVARSEERFAHDLRQMLMIFGYLADLGIAPFTSGQVAYVKKRAFPDWANLPQELHYLVAEVDHYESYLSEERMVTFADTAGPGELERLSSLAEKMRSRGHGPVISAWLRGKPFQKHPEAWLVYCLMGLLDYSGFEVGL